MTRIVFSDDRDGGDVVATGVEFEYAGRKHIVHAKEIILSAGYAVRFTVKRDTYAMCRKGDDVSGDP